jgi:hypothetical protein
MKSLFVVASIGCVSAWWDQGHLLTARRAYDILQDQHPQILELANKMLVPLKQHYPEITKTEKDFPFVETATFADVIREPGQAYGW